MGLVVDDGKLRLDDTVSTYFPEWKDQPRKRDITIRHLLSHTSGLAASPDAANIYAVDDSVKLALAATAEVDPGMRFAYDNNVVNLLPALIERASGTDMVSLLNERVFAPLGITDVYWVGDQAGNSYGMAGLEIRPIDFAKIGQMLLERLTEKRLRVGRFDALAPFASGDLGLGLVKGRTQGLRTWQRVAVERLAEVREIAVVGAAERGLVGR